MEFRHLSYFLVLAEEMHFGLAAKRLAVTQTHLSQNIQHLEEAVGARLLERDLNGVKLTAAGEAFRTSAQALLAQAEYAGIMARDSCAGAAGRLRIGFVGSMLFRGLPQWFETFQRSHPRIEITFNELNSQEQIDALMHEKLDLGFIHTQQVPSDLETRRIQSEPFLACLPADHPLANRDEISLSMLRDEPFVLFSRQVSPDYHARIIQACARQGFVMRIRHEVRHWLSVCSLVGQGMGVSIVPASLSRAGLAGTVFKPISEDLVPSEVFAVWKKGLGLQAREDFLSLALQKSKPAQS